LSDILNNMQCRYLVWVLRKPGSGQGTQLPDIIKKARGALRKTKEGMEKGQKPG
jgi:hypothetical protein